MSTRCVRSRRASPILLEQLETRELLTQNPFGTSTFRSEIKGLMQSNDLPQFSLDARISGRDYSYEFTNRSFTGFAGHKKPKPSSTSLFRLASVTKVFTAAVIMKEVQDGQLSLSDSAFQLLGFFDANGNPIPQTGYNPVTGAPVTYTPSSELYGITIQSLLNMSSGLPQSVPVESSSFPVPQGQKHLYGPVIYVQGSYAALSFSGPPPYSAPATEAQQMNYYVYTVSQNHVPLVNPGTYDYSDTGYALLGVVANAVSEKYDDLPYLSYLQQQILTPLGISPPKAHPGPHAAMAGIAGTLESQRYPTEVTYYANASEPPETSIIPDPTATTPPFYPSGTVPQQYGGLADYPSHFGEGGMAANPRALVRLFGGLFAAYEGQSGLPLSQATVSEMVNPANGVPVPGSSSWWGLGWQVFSAPNNPDQPGNWVKNGGLPGTSSLLFQGADGTTWAYTLNENDGDAVGGSNQPFASALQADIQAAIAALPQKASRK